MVNLCGNGGAEGHARFKQYDYRASASLVLTSDSRRLETHKPTGEAESLCGKIDPKTFGDRVSRVKPTLMKKRKELDQQPKSGGFHKKTKKQRRILKEESVLSAFDGGPRKPKRDKTEAVYNLMHDVIQRQLGGHPDCVLYCAPDEVLAVLKNETIKSSDKKKEIEKVLNSLSDSVFNDRVSIGNEVTDYNQFEDDNSVLSNAMDIDDDMGVAVEFQEDEDEEEEGSDLHMVHEDEDDDVGNGVAEPATMRVGGGIDDDGDTKEANTLWFSYLYREEI